MTRDDLDAHYRCYIDCLNGRQLDRMNRFYADELLYNGRRMSRSEWLEVAIKASFDAIPDLQWNIQHLVIEHETVAARLVDTGTLVKPWSGLQPSHQKLRFGEHVFYRFRDFDGLADEVWSIVDIGNATTINVGI